MTEEIGPPRLPPAPPPTSGLGELPNRAIRVADLIFLAYLPPPPRLLARRLYPFGNLILYSLPLPETWAWLRTSYSRRLPPRYGKRTPPHYPSSPDAREGSGCNRELPHRPDPTSGAWSRPRRVRESELARPFSFYLSSFRRSLRYSFPGNLFASATKT